MSRSLFIQATNIHQGGGGSLLTALLAGMPADVDLKLAVDSRFPLSPESLSAAGVKRVRASIVERFQAEKHLAEQVGPGDLVLCFGNLPPLFKLRGKAMVFLQNRYLIDSVGLKDFPLAAKLRIWLERIWFKSRLKNVDAVIVQTPSMKQLLQQSSPPELSVLVSPFIGDSPATYKRKPAARDLTAQQARKFLYVASGDGHKNHRRLIEAWILLAREGLFPRLALTIDDRQYPSLCRWIKNQSASFQLDIENLGLLDSVELKLQYDKADALIYPSTLESFGLPLIEARQAGLVILAAELDYVRDIVDPEQSFDPTSSRSIARAVKRFLQVEEAPLPLLDATDFLRQILESDHSC